MHSYPVTGRENFLHKNYLIETIAELVLHEKKNERR